MIRLYAAKAPLAWIKGLIRDIRPTWLLEELGQKYERISLDPTKGETRSSGYLAVNPFGKIPAAVVDDVCLFQSSNLCLHIADRAGRMVPTAGTVERALHDQWVFLAQTDIEPRASEVNFARFFMKDDEPKAWFEARALRLLHAYLPTIEKELAMRPYISGAEFAVADIVLSCALRSLLAKDAEGALYAVSEVAALKDYPQLRAYLEKNYARPAFRRAFEINGT